MTKTEVKQALKETTVISIVTILLVAGPWLIVRSRHEAYLKRRMKSVSAIAIVTYPLAIALSIPVQASWMILYPLRLGVKYVRIKNFYAKLRNGRTMSTDRF